MGLQHDLVTEQQLQQLGIIIFTLSNFTTLLFSLCQEEATEGNKAGPRVPAGKETHTSYPLACSLADPELLEEEDCLPPSPNDSPLLDSKEN